MGIGVETRITITGPNGPCEIHSATCKDLYSAKFRNSRSEFWTIDETDFHKIAIEIWGDCASDDYEYDSAEWHSACDDYMADYRIMPCAKYIH